MGQELALLLVLVSGISCSNHMHKQRVSRVAVEVLPNKKFNIVTHSKTQDSMMVVMKGMDGLNGNNGTQGDAGPPGPPGQIGLPGQKGIQGVCTRQQCESNELKVLIQRVNELEKYVKDKQNKSGGGGGQPCVQPTQPITSASNLCPTTASPATPAPFQIPKAPMPAPAPAPGPLPVPTVSAPVPAPSSAPFPAPSPASGQGQGPVTASAPVPVPALVPSPVSASSPAPAPAPAPGQGTVTAPAPSPVPFPVQAPAPALTSTAQSLPLTAIPASSPQVLWASPSPPPVSSPVSFTVESVVDAPGSFAGQSNHVDIQGSVTPEVSVQGYMGNVASSPGMQPSAQFKKYRIPSHHSHHHKHTFKKTLHPMPISHHGKRAKKI